MTETNELLKQGIAALKAGHKAEARSLLMQVVEQDEHNETAWLWLSGAVDTDEERRICLENVLAINPNNGMARRGLEHLLARKGGQQMNEVTKRDTVTFRCEQCGREGAEAIFTCPERPSGHCPFVEQWRKKTYNQIEILIGLLGLLILPAIFPQDTRVTIFCLGVVPFLGWILFVRPVERVQLYNANSGVRLQRTTIWGFEFSYKWTTSGKPVLIDLELSQPLAYPPSITALPTELHKVSMEQAVAILRAALIGLLAQGHIQVYHFQSYEFKRWGRRQSVQNVYSIVATQAQFKGRLERGIRQVLANWSKQEEAKEWPKGPPVYDLVRAIYESDKDAPSKWLAQLVVKDAAAQGLGQIKGTLRKRFELDAAHANQIQQEQEIMKALSERLAQLHPNFSLALDEQIEKGTKSRIEKGC